MPEFGPPENGPRTHELVEEMREIRKRFDERGNEIQGRLTDIESQLRTIRAVFGVGGSIITGLLVALGIHVLL